VSERYQDVCRSCSVVGKVCDIGDAIATGCSAATAFVYLTFQKFNEDCRMFVAQFLAQAPPKFQQKKRQRELQMLREPSTRKKRTICGNDRGFECPKITNQQIKETKRARRTIAKYRSARAHGPFTGHGSEACAPGGEAHGRAFGSRGVRSRWGRWQPEAPGRSSRGFQ